MKEMKEVKKIIFEIFFFFLSSASIYLRGSHPIARSSPIHLDGIFRTKKSMK